MLQDFADFHLTLQQIFLWHSDLGFGISQVIPNLGWLVAPSFSFLLYMEHHHNQQWVIFFLWTIKDWPRLKEKYSVYICIYIYTVNWWILNCHVWLPEGHSHFHIQVPSNHHEIPKNPIKPSFIPWNISLNTSGWRWSSPSAAVGFPLFLLVSRIRETSPWVTAMNCNLWKRWAIYLYLYCIYT